MPKKPENIKFGEEIQKIRKSKGIGIRELAKKVGMQTAYVDRIERGGVSPSDKFICKAAKVLSESPKVLASHAGMVTKRLAVAISKNPKVFSDLIFQLENAPENAILRIIREVREGEW